VHEFKHTYLKYLTRPRRGNESIAEEIRARSLEIGSNFKDRISSSSFPVFHRT